MLNFIIRNIKIDLTLSPERATSMSFILIFQHQKFKLIVVKSQKNSAYKDIIYIDISLKNQKLNQIQYFYIYDDNKEKVGRINYKCMSNK